MSKHSPNPAHTVAQLRTLTRSVTLRTTVAAFLVLLAILLMIFDGQRGTTAPGTAGADRFARPGRTTAEDRRASRPPRNDAPGELGDVIRLARDGATRSDRLEAIATLGNSDRKLSEPVLLELLSDSDPESRDAAVESLAALGTPGAIDGLAFALLDECPLVRRSALELLAENGTAKAIEALEITLHEPDHTLRSSVVHELVDLDSPAARSLLQEFLSDHDPRVRRTAELAVPSTAQPK